MLAELLHWWARQMAELLPGHAPAGALPRRALLAEYGPEAVTLSQRRGGVERVLTRIAPAPPADGAAAAALRPALRAAGRVPLVLRLPPGALLVREVVLPLAAE